MVRSQVQARQPSVSVGMPSQQSADDLPVPPKKKSYADTKVGMLAPSVKSSDAPSDSYEAAVNSKPDRGITKFTSLGTSKRTVAETAGLSKEKPPTPFYTLDETSILLPEPTEHHKKLHNKKGLPIVEVVIDPMIGARLREHQKEGIRFMYECVMGMRQDGQGCILADEMGLGKTCQTIALIWTLLKQTPYFGAPPIVQRVVIVCPVTLVANWAREIKKWLGGRLSCLRADDKTNKNLKHQLANVRTYPVLIIGYEKVSSTRGHFVIRLTHL